LRAEVDLHLAGLAHQLPVGDPVLVGEAGPGTAEVAGPGIAVGADPGTAAEVLGPGTAEAVDPGIAEEEVVLGIVEEEVAALGIVVEVDPGIAEVAAPGTVGADLGPEIAAAAADTAVD